MLRKVCQLNCPGMWAFRVELAATSMRRFKGFSPISILDCLAFPKLKVSPLLLEQLFFAADNAFAGGLGLGEHFFGLFECNCFWICRFRDTSILFAIGDIGAILTV